MDPDGYAALGLDESTGRNVNLDYEVEQLSGRLGTFHAGSSVPIELGA